MSQPPSIPWPVDSIGNVAPAESRRSIGRLPNPCWLLNLDQIEKETGYLGEREWVDPANASNSTHAFTTDHVLYSKLRPNLNKVVCPDEPGICTTELIRLRPDPHRLKRKFLTYFLRSEYYMGFARQVVAGAKMPRMVMDRFWEFEIPLPPLPEQDRIVEILDQADALRQQRRQADALSQRILPALFQEMFGDPLSRTSKWHKKPLGEMGTLDRGVSKCRPRNSPELLGGPYPLIQTGDIANSSGIIKTFSSSYSEIGLAQSKLWPAKTLCITIAANIGKTGILDFEACFPDSVVGFIPNDQTDVEYVQSLFHFFQPMLEMNAPQAAQKNINLKTLRELEVPAPPYELQLRFGEAIRGFRKTLDSQTTSATTLETLFHTLLHRAFDGSLTAQWREGQAKEVLQEMERNANELP